LVTKNEIQGLMCDMYKLRSVEKRVAPLLSLRVPHGPLQMARVSIVKEVKE
jgi:hypothetical protein